LSKGRNIPDMTHVSAASWVTPYLRPGFRIYWLLSQWPL